MQPSEAQGDTHRQSQLRERLGQGPKQGTQLEWTEPQRGEQWPLEDWRRLVGQSD